MRGSGKDRLYDLTYRRDLKKRNQEKEIRFTVTAGRAGEDGMEVDGSPNVPLQERSVLGQSRAAW